MDKRVGKIVEEIESRTTNFCVVFSDVTDLTCYTTRIEIPIFHHDINMAPIVTAISANMSCTSLEVPSISWYLPKILAKTQSIERIHVGTVDHYSVHWMKRLLCENYTVMYVNTNRMSHSRERDDILDILKRNRVATKKWQAAIITLLCIHRYRKHECAIHYNVLPQIIDLLWRMRIDIAWRD